LRHQSPFIKLIGSPPWRKHQIETMDELLV
jgi:hypothetical protein